MSDDRALRTLVRSSYDELDPSLDPRSLLARGAERRRRRDHRRRVGIGVAACALVALVAVGTGALVRHGSSAPTTSPASEPAPAIFGSFGGYRVVAGAGWTARVPSGWRADVVESGCTTTALVVRPPADSSGTGGAACDVVRGRSPGVRLTSGPAGATPATASPTTVVSSTPRSIDVDGSRFEADVVEPREQPPAVRAELARVASTAVPGAIDATTAKRQTPDEVTTRLDAGLDLGRGAPLEIVVPTDATRWTIGQVHRVAAPSPDAGVVELMYTLPSPQTSVSLCSSTSGALGACQPEGPTTVVTIGGAPWSCDADLRCARQDHVADHTVGLSILDGLVPVRDLDQLAAGLRTLVVVGS